MNMRDSNLFLDSLKATGQEVTAREIIPKPGNDGRELSRDWGAGGAGWAVWEEAVWEESWKKPQESPLEKFPVQY